MDRKKLEHYYNKQRYLTSKIKSYQERRDSIGRLAASYEGATGKMSSISKTTIQDKEAEELSRLIDDLGAEIDKIVLEGNKELIELNHTLDKLENPVHKLILSKRYLER